MAAIASRLDDKLVVDSKDESSTDGAAINSVPMFLGEVCKSVVELQHCASDDVGGRVLAHGAHRLTLSLCAFMRRRRMDARDLSYTTVVNESTTTEPVVEATSTHLTHVVCRRGCGQSHPCDRPNESRR